MVSATRYQVTLVKRNKLETHRICTIWRSWGLQSGTKICPKSTRHPTHTKIVTFKRFSCARTLKNTFRARFTQHSGSVLSTVVRPNNYRVLIATASFLLEISTECDNNWVWIRNRSFSFETTIGVFISVVKTPIRVLDNRGVQDLAFLPFPVRSDRRSKSQHHKVGIKVRP